MADKEPGVADTPPPAKKAKQLVQARLPFAPLNKSAPSALANQQKKRKLSDDSVKSIVPKKGPKISSNDEPILIEDSDEKDENVMDVPIDENSSSKDIMDNFIIKLSQEDRERADAKLKSMSQKTPEKKTPSSTAPSTPSETVSITSSSESGTPSKSDKADEDSDSESTEKQNAGSETSPCVPRKRRVPDVAKLKEKEEQKNKKQKEKEEKEKQRKELKEKKEKEKMLEKERKEKERQAEKERKEKEKEELKKKKEQARLEKEKEKEEKRKQLEEEKRKKQEQKDEEKRKKQEIIDAKNAEKKQKEEEKRKADEEKRKAEEEKNKVKQKQKALFTNFFQQSSPKDPAPKVESSSTATGMFIAFEKKKDMYLAPSTRATLKCEQAKNLDSLLQSQSPDKTYLAELRAGKSVGRSSRTNTGRDDIQIVEPSSSSATVMKAKFLKFHENHRPAYYGTWRKSSSHVSARRPLGMDKELLDYEVDSDDEWEEEEPGESLSDSEGEGDDDEEKTPGDDDEDEDGFFVPHGYLSEGEGCDDDEDDNTPERLKARQQARARAFEIEMKNMQKCELLKPKCIGCCWFNPSENEEESPEVKLLLQFKAVPLVPSLPILIEAEASAAVEVSEKGGSGEKEKKGPKLMPVPDEAIPELIRLVHGNSFSIQKLIKEFREYWHRKTLGESNLPSADLADTPGGPSAPGTPTCHTPVPAGTPSDTPDRPNSTSPKGDTGDTPADKKVYAISKRQLDAKIREIANYEKRDDCKRSCWYVFPQLLDKHDMNNLPVPTEWKWITRVEKPKKKAVAATPDSVTQTPTGKSTPPPTAGRQTPTASSIKQFTVKNMSPLLFSPVSSKVAAAASEKSTEVLKPTPVKAQASATPEASDAVKPKEPSVLMKMFSNMAADKSKPAKNEAKSEHSESKPKSGTDKKNDEVIVLD